MRYYNNHGKRHRLAAIVHTLDTKKVLQTIVRLEQRINERFPDSGLEQVCTDFLGIAERTQNRIQWIEKPNLWLRWGIAAVILAGLTIFVYSLSLLELRVRLPDLAESIQILEALLNDVILIGAAVFFLITIEARIKRARTLQALHELRGMAHVVDMHQLTKDPAVIVNDNPTNSSPTRNLTAFQLKRYLDYCSELLSLIGKMAALYSQRLPDPQIVTAASEVEALCTSLSRKIWQKIVMIDA